MAKNSRSQWIAKNLQRLLNAGLIILAAILVVFLVKETIHLGQMLFMNNQETSSSLARTLYSSTCLYLVRSSRRGLSAV